MLKVLDKVLSLGGTVFCLFVLTGIVLVFVQEQCPAIEKKLKYFFNTKFGMILLAIIAIWGAIGATYTVTFHWCPLKRAALVFLYSSLLIVWHVCRLDNLLKFEVEVDIAILYSI